jgi:hypothetical protein
VIIKCIPGNKLLLNDQEIYGIIAILRKIEVGGN